MIPFSKSVVGIILCGALMATGLPVGGLLGVLIASIGALVIGFAAVRLMSDYPILATGALLSTLIIAVLMGVREGIQSCLMIILSGCIGLSVFFLMQRYVKNSFYK